MSARNRADPIVSRTAFRDNRGLELPRPFPPLARAREYLKPLRALAHRIITQDYHSRSTPPKSRQENRRYASDAQGGAGTALTFYAWTRSHVTGQRAPFGAIKDVAILSALVGNAATLILVLIAWPMLATIDLGIGRGPLVASIALLATISISMIVFRKKVFQLSRGDVAFVGIVHLARTILTVGLVALLWHLALPDIALRWWLLLSTGRMIVSRLPLIPNKDLAFAGVAAFVFQHNLQIVGLMAMTAMLIFAAHLVFGIGFIAGDFKQRITR